MTRRQLLPPPHHHCQHLAGLSRPNILPLQRLDVEGDFSATDASAFRGVASDGRQLRLADLPIVEKIYILNSAVVVIFTCGVVSAFHWQLILEYEGVKESSRWTEKQEKTVDVGTNTDGCGNRVWWKFSG